MQCMRHLRLWCWRGRPSGAAIVRVIPVICCAMIVLRVAAVVARVHRLNRDGRAAIWSVPQSQTS